MGSMGMGAQTATVSPLAKYKLVFLGDQSVGKYDFLAVKRSSRMVVTFLSDDNFQSRFWSSDAC